MYGSPSNPALMDWSVHFPAFIDHEATESAAKQLAVEQEEEKEQPGSIRIDYTAGKTSNIAHQAS